MVPQAFDNGGYEGFEDLVDRAVAWLKEQKSDIVVTNLQSIMVLKDNGQYSVHYTSHLLRTSLPTKNFVRDLSIKTRSGRVLHVGGWAWPTPVTLAVIGRP